MTKGLQKYLLLFIGLALFLAAYFLVYMNFSDKTDALNVEIATLNNRLDLLEGYYSRFQEFQKTIDNDKERIGGTLGTYYNMERPEDFIMFAAGAENEIGVKIDTIAFTEPEQVLEIAGVKDGPDEMSPGQPLKLTAYGSSATLSGTMSYAQMKTLLDHIDAQKDVTKLDSLDVSYDGTSGFLIGNLTVSKYFITGLSGPEHKPVIPYASIGNTHLMN